MKFSSHLLRSVLLTTFFSFAAPIIVAGMLLMSFWLFQMLPYGHDVGQLCINQVLTFLAVFGNGHPVEGSITIGLCWGFVGAMFDLCTFYRYQHL
ncbi:hypothetical protein [Spirulina subsalsa]|uniref:hypothetical protein n=1 Tax=Spirulina subsalsa TaxID=54311 RepID=UPI00036966CE|nr:hypothetical protein [Spirulina subsalsa]